MGKEKGSSTASAANSVLHRVRDTILTKIVEHKGIDLDHLKSGLYLSKENTFFIKNLEHFEPSLRSLSTLFKFDLLKPEKVTVIGSYLLGTMVGKRPNINVGITYPQKMWSKGDEKHGKYLLKRSMLLDVIFSALKKAFPKAQTTITLWRGHHLMQRILLKTEEVDVEVSILLDEIPFKISHTPSPTTTNLILSDHLPIHHMKQLNEMIAAIPTVKGALRLTNTFIKSMPSSVICNFHLSMIALYLWRRDLVVAEMNEIQIFRCILTFISKMNTGRDGNVGTGHKDLANCYPISPSSTPATNECYSINYPIISLVEEVDGMNLLFDITVENWSSIVREAEEALRLLAIPSLYKEIFCTKHYANGCWDLLLSFDGGVKYWPPVKGNEGHYLSEGPFPFLARNRLIARRLRYALGVRIDALQVEGTSNNSPILLRVKFSKEPSSKYIVTEAQSADGAMEEEIRKFRGFWRDRATLRKFPDSTVRFSVEWTSYHDAIEWVMKTYFSYFATSSIPLEKYLLPFGVGINSIITSSISKSFNELCKSLRSIKGLPMMINVVSPISPAIKGLDGGMDEDGGSGGGGVNASMLFRDDKQSPVVHDCLIRLEGSSRYPTNWVGFRLTKRAYLAEMSLKLKEELGLKSVISSSCEDSLLDWIEVEMDRSVYFRCYLHCIGASGTDDDLVLDQRMLKDQMISEEELQVVGSILAKLPLHYKKVDLWSTEFPYWKCACRTLKRWLSLNMALPLGEDGLRGWNLMVEEESFKVIRKTGIPNSEFTTFIKFLWLISLGQLFGGRGLESSARQSISLIEGGNEDVLEDRLSDFDCDRFDHFMKVGLKDHKGGRCDLPGFTPQAMLLKDLTKMYPSVLLYPQFLRIDKYSHCDDGFLVGVKGLSEDLVDGFSSFAPELFTLSIDC